MAITSADLYLWKLLKSANAIPLNPRVLEIGEANWYGDAPTPEGCHETEPFAVADVYYRNLFGEHDRVAIDMDGTERALRLDLNSELAELDEVDSDWRNGFDLVINTGTAEHVFDQRNVFSYIHFFCKPGGLMVHAAPVGGGWIGHGLYTYSPVLFELLGLANGYTTLASFLFDIDTGKIALQMPLTGRVMLYVAWRKERDSAFVVPQQEEYR